MPCSCNKPSQNFITLNQVAAPTRKTWRDEEWLVVPVVMAKEGVEMNGAIIPGEEFFAPSWNGVPVTFGHPEDAAGNFLSANSPDTLDDWGVGYIFGAEYTGGKLKAEAWININRAEELREGSIEALESGDLEIDVSTGYFAQHNQGDGVVIHEDIKPDHLAILFGIPGACSFEDGCGVRANQHEGEKMPKKTAIAAAIATLNSAFGSQSQIDVNGEDQFQKDLKAEVNRRGQPDDFRQMVADLISSEDSPFVPEDMYGLVDLSIETVKMLRDQYINLGGEEPDTNSQDDDQQTASEPGAQNQQEGDMPDEKAPVKEPEVNNQAALSDEDKQALEFARNQFAEHRNSLVKRIVGNSDMTEEQLKGMDVPTLETIANGLKPAVNYSARAAAGQPLAVNGEDEQEAETAKSMQAPNVFEAMSQKEAK